MPYNRSMTIAEVLADRRDHMQPRPTEEAIGAFFGVTQVTIGRWLKGEVTPGDDHVGRLVEFTGLSEDQVLRALHVQRAQRRSMPQRVTALEERIDAMTAQLQVLADRLAERDG